MKKMLAFALATFIAAALFTTVALAATNVSGTYTGILKTNEGGAFEVELVLKQTGDRISGTFRQGDREPSPIDDGGTVSGDTIKFSLTAHSGDGKSRKINYVGKISGTDLKLSRTIEGSTKGNAEISLKKEH